MKDLRWLESELDTAADPGAARLAFERLLARVGEPDAPAVDLPSDPNLPRLLAAVLGGSRFLSEVLIRRPEHLAGLVAEAFATRTKGRAAFLEDAREAMGAQEPLGSLHRFHRREILRIGARDLLGAASMSEVTRELSWLADATIQMVCEHAWKELAARPGVPDVEFAVIGLGKLGGEELNFSSDIDILYVFSEERFTDFCFKLARRITKLLSEVTSEGAFYRVDLRLRPEGSRGAVASPMNALRTYYDSWGETFERLALAKARAVAGHPGVGKRFEELAASFVYRGYLDFAAIDEIREIKRRIDAQVGQSGELERNVKLGRGGIREIEFFAQILQVLYGGEIEGLRVRATLQALRELEEAHVIEVATARKLRDAYVFLRNVEHKLQIVNHLQTHTLPDDPEEIGRCARRMRMSAGSFTTALAEHRDAVHGAFRNLFAGRARTGQGMAGFVHGFVNGRLDEAATIAAVGNLGFENPRQVYSNLAELRDAPAFGRSPTRMKNLLANVLTPVMDEAVRLPRRDEVVNLFERLTSSIGAREGFFKSLLENRRSISRLVRVLALSEYLSEILIDFPELLDFVIDEAIFNRPVLVPPESSNRRIVEFQAGTQFLSGILSRKRASRMLSRFAERELRKALGSKARVALFAVGKFGEHELNYRSDLDIVAFHSGDYGPARRAVERLIEKMAPAFRLDLRLRPEGKKGSLAWSSEKYAEYLLERGEVWERMALTKARFVAGDPGVAQTIEPLIDRFVYRRPFGSEELQKMKHIRGRMERELGKESADAWDLKLGRGGLVDIEFLVEYRQIVHGVRVPNTLIALRRLGLPPVLAEHYEFLRNVESMLRLWSTRAGTRFDRRDLEALGVLLGIKDFEKTYARVTGEVRSTVDSGR